MSALLPVLVLVAGAAPPQPADAWPGFRGRGDGVSTARGLPLKWSESENLAWKADLPGYGQSSPVVWKGVVFVTAVDGQQREKGYVLAYDARTGKRLWAHGFAPTQKARWGNTVSRAAPTPAVDAAAVYAFFEGGDLLALSHRGKPLWSRSLVKDYGEFKGGHGLGSSPAQTDDAVLVLADHRGPSYLLAVDKRSGKTLWKADRKARTSWASPAVAYRGGRPEVVVSSGGSVAGYDAATGKLLWELDGLGGNTIPSASVSGDLILVGAGAGRGGDAKAAATSNRCLKLAGKDGKPGFEPLWTAENVSASYASPLAYRGHAYFVNDAGVASCLDLATGNPRYAKRVAGPCWASPVGAAGHVFFFGKDGRTTVLKAGPGHAHVATNRLWNPDKLPARKQQPPDARPSDENGKGGPARADAADLDLVVYGVAAVDGAFFVRTGTALYRIGKP